MSILIRPVEQHELPETVNIYLTCIREDDSYKPQSYLDALNPADELADCKEWLYQPGGNNQVFVAMDGDVMAGYIAVSPNTVEPLEYEGEVNGFFIRKAYRGRGIGFMLLRRGLKFLIELGFTGLVIYNYHISAANTYYRMLGGEVVKQEVQHPGGMALETDVFGFKINTLMEILDQKLEKYAG
jgi:GNAT superfamily N-acetyltransferase